MSNRTNAGNPVNRQAIKLEITLDAAGKVNVSGPIHDRLLCFGLLEFAKQTIIEFQNNKADASASIEVPTPSAVEMLLNQAG